MIRRTNVVLLLTTGYTQVKITTKTKSMISNFTLVGAESYRIVGKKPHSKIYRLPYIDRKGRQQSLKEIKSTMNGGYWIVFDNGEKKFISLRQLQTNQALLKKDRMVINFKEKGMPF